VLTIGGIEVRFYFVDRFGDDDLMIVDAFFVAFNLHFITCLPYLMALVRVGSYVLTNSGAGSGICAALDIEGRDWASVTMGGVKDSEPSFVSMFAGAF
jgi:hypothetical protein